VLQCASLWPLLYMILRALGFAQAKVRQAASPVTGCIAGRAAAREHETKP
jgi:hypothetical protein